MVRILVTLNQDVVSLLGDYTQVTDTVLKVTDTVLLPCTVRKVLDRVPVMDKTGFNPDRGLSCLGLLQDFWLTDTPGVRLDRVG